MDYKTILIWYCNVSLILGCLMLMYFVLEPLFVKNPDPKFGYTLSTTPGRQLAVVAILAIGVPFVNLFTISGYIAAWVGGIVSKHFKKTVFEKYATVFDAEHGVCFSACPVCACTRVPNFTTAYNVESKLTDVTMSCSGHGCSHEVTEHQASCCAQKWTLDFIRRYGRPFEQWRATKPHYITHHDFRRRPEEKK